MTIEELYKYAKEHDLENRDIVIIAPSSFEGDYETKIIRTTHKGRRLG